MSTVFTLTPSSLQPRGCNDDNLLSPATKEEEKEEEEEDEEEEEEY